MSISRSRWREEFPRLNKVEGGVPKTYQKSQGHKVHSYGHCKVIFESSLTLKKVHLVKWRLTCNHTSICKNLVKLIIFANLDFFPFLHLKQAIGLGPYVRPHDFTLSDSAADSILVFSVISFTSLSLIGGVYSRKIKI